MQKIDDEQNAIRILQLVQSMSPDTIWTSGILAVMLGISLTKAEHAVVGLVNAGYMTTGYGLYRLTIEGEEYYEAARRKPQFSISLTEFRDEVLTGMDKKGGRSLIDTAVLPANQAPTYTDNADELIARRQISARIKRRTCVELGIMIDEFETRLLDGSLQICTGGEDGPHIGIFHRKRETKTGQGWQHICKRCLRSKKTNG